MTKKMRQQIVLDAIRGKKIYTLSDLLKEVSRKHCKVDISTLSRDIAELGVAKTFEGYKILHAADGGSEILPAQVTTLQQMITGIKAVGTTVVIHTITGGAQAVARLLDILPDSGLVGTVAGDDTIFAIAATNKDADKFVKLVAQTIEQR